MKKVCFIVISLAYLMSLAPGVQAMDVNTQFIDAVRSGNLEKAKSLIAEGADVKAKDKSGVSSLIYATLSGNEDLVKLLVDKGADVNASSKGGVTPLMAASLNTRNLGIARFLIEKGAKVNVKTKEGMTALKYSTFLQSSNSNISKVLAEKSTETKDKRYAGLIPKKLDNAPTNPMADLLKKHGAE